MSEIQKALLRTVDPLKAKLITLDGAMIRVMVDGQLSRFEFESADSARRAFDEWVTLNPTVERSQD